MMMNDHTSSTAPVSCRIFAVRGFLRAAAATIKAMATPKAQGRRDGRPSAATWRRFGTSASSGRLAVARQS